MNGECFVGILRASRVKPAEVAELLGPRVPTWLPVASGFSVPGTEQVRGGSYGAIWTDETCRQVMLEVWPDAAGAESPMPDGRWVLSSAATCTYAAVRNVRCLNYHAQVGGDAISLQLVDLTQQEAIRVVTGIRIRTPSPGGVSIDVVSGSKAFRVCSTSPLTVSLQHARSDHILRSRPLRR